MAISIRPLSGALGAEIEGVDLGHALDPDTVERIHAAWLQHQVIVFRGQDLSEDDQSRFGRYFGDLQAVLSRPGERAPNEHVMFVGNVTIDGRKGELPDGELQFHSDQCYYEVPSKATILYAIDIPSHGGNTLFANTYLAYEALPEALRRRLDGLDCRFLYDYRNAPYKRVGTFAADAPRYTHPAVILHPETRRPALFVNPLMSDHLVGIDEAESRSVLEHLYTIQQRSEFVYEHVWRRSDLVMWDNRCTLHARTDFDPAERRALRRITLKGERPVAARDGETASAV